VPSRSSAVDHAIATGIQPDMREHGWERDGSPAIFEKVIAADILVLLSPIWLGEKSSVCTQVIERLYGNSHLLNEHSQYALLVQLIRAGAYQGARAAATSAVSSEARTKHTIPSRNFQ